MKAIRITIITSLIMMASCVDVKINRIDYIINHDLFLAYKDINNSLTSKRTELSFSDRSRANNCNTYFNLISQHKLDESIYNNAVKSEYLICDALKILSIASVYAIEKDSDFNFGEKLSSKLDLRSFPSSLNNLCDERKHNLKSLYPTEIRHEGSVTVLETDDFLYRLEVVAVARINSNKILDWIVWLTDETKSGNYRSYSTLIIYDPCDQENYLAASYP